MDRSKLAVLAPSLSSRKSRRSLVRAFIGGGLSLAFVRREQTLAAPQTKVAICHQTGTKSTSYKLIFVPEKALSAHIAHGDFEPYDCACGPSCEISCSDAGEPHLLFNCGPGYDCPTGATTFCPGGPLDPTSSNQAQAACEACFGAGACVHFTNDCSGDGWLEVFDPVDEPPLGSPLFSYETSSCSGPIQPAWRVYFSGNSVPEQDYGYWGLGICP